MHIETKEALKIIAEDILEFQDKEGNNLAKTYQNEWLVKRLNERTMEILIENLNCYDGLITPEAFIASAHKAIIPKKREAGFVTLASQDFYYELLNHNGKLVQKVEDITGYLHDVILFD